MYYPQKAFVARLEQDSQHSNREAYTTFSGFVGPLGAQTAAIQLNVQPASPEFTALFDGVQGKMFKAFTPASGVVEGHKLTMSGTGEEYIVRGRMPFGYGLGQHYELALVASER